MRGAKGGPCSGYFSGKTVLSNLNNCLEQSSTELDLVILANIQAFTRIEHIGRKSPHCNFLHQSVPICNSYVSAPVWIKLLQVLPTEGTL